MRAALMLTRRVASREVIEACCARGVRAGVRKGMDLAQARAMIGRGWQVWHEPARPRRDAGSLRSLAAWSLRFSPCVMPLQTRGDHGLALDASGMGRVYRDESELLQRATNAYSRLGFANRACVAPTLACAWALARFGDANRAIVPHGSVRDALGPLPLECLDADPSSLESLRGVGVTHVRELLAISRRELLARYPVSLLEGLDRALGRAAEPPIDPVRPFQPIVGEFVFDGPTDRPEALWAGASIALDRLLSALAAHQRAVRTLAVRVLRPDGPADGFDIPFASASDRREHIARMLRTRLERVDLSRSVDGLRLRASRTAPLRHQQSIASGPAGNWIDGASDARGEGNAGELLDALVARLGRERVLRARLRWSHLPERVITFESVLDQSDDRSLDEQPRGQPGTDHDLEFRLGGMTRPTILLAAPQPVRVVALHPDGPVARITWQGREHAILACLGPERIAAEWWRWAQDRPAPADRDYFRVQLDDGRWLLACRAGERWVVQGVWG